MSGLSLSIVNHPPALADWGDEGAGIGIAWLGHRHGLRVDLGRIAAVPERTVLLHETPQPTLDAPAVRTWHLEGDDSSETLCGANTRDMAAVPTFWEEVLSPCSGCEQLWCN